MKLEGALKRLNLDVGYQTLLAIHAFIHDTESTTFTTNSNLKIHQIQNATKALA